MNQVAIFTFRSLANNYRLSNNVFIFGKLKEDLEKFFRIIESEKPNYILGIGNSEITRLESQAINQFNQGKIIAGGPNYYQLFVPHNGLIIADRPTSSFCNWTTYQIANFLERNSLETKLCFLHVKNQDELDILYNLKKVLDSLRSLEQ